MPSWAEGDEEGRMAEWAGVGRHKLAQAPRGAQYGASLPPRMIRCYRDCRAQVTGDPRDCRCAERDAAARDAEDNAIYDRERDRDDC